MNYNTEQNYDDNDYNTGIDISEETAEMYDLQFSLSHLDCMLARVEDHIADRVRGGWELPDLDLPNYYSTYPGLIGWHERHNRALMPEEKYLAIYSCHIQNCFRRGWATIGAAAGCYGEESWNVPATEFLNLKASRRPGAVKAVDMTQLRRTQENNQNAYNQAQVELKQFEAMDIIKAYKKAIKRRDTARKQLNSTNAKVRRAASKA